MIYITTSFIFIIIAAMYNQLEIVKCLLEREDKDRGYNEGYNKNANVIVTVDRWNKIQKERVDIMKMKKNGFSLN